MVAGAAGLVLTTDPPFRGKANAAAALKARILCTADKSPKLAVDFRDGNRLNALRAVVPPGQCQ